MNLTEHIQRYLQKKNAWVPDEILYVLAQREGYPRFVITKALYKIGKTAPYACEYRKGSGKYYRWYDIPQEQIDVINKNNIEW
jgi:hypothetical protein